MVKWTREDLQMDQKTRKLMTMDKVLHLRDDVDRLCQEKKEEEDLPAFKRASMHRYNDYKTTLKSTKEDRLQSPETIQTNHVSTEQK